MPFFFKPRTTKDFGDLQQQSVRYRYRDEAARLPAVRRALDKEIEAQRFGTDVFLGHFNLRPVDGGLRGLLGPRRPATVLYHAPTRGVVAFTVWASGRDLIIETFVATRKRLEILGKGWFWALIFVAAKLWLLAPLVTRWQCWPAALGVGVAALALSRFMPLLAVAAAVLAPWPWTETDLYSVLDTYSDYSEPVLGFSGFEVGDVATFPFRAVAEFLVANTGFNLTALWALAAVAAAIVVIVPAAVAAGLGVVILSLTRAGSLVRDANEFEAGDAQNIRDGAQEARERAVAAAGVNPTLREVERLDGTGWSSRR